MCRGGGGGGGGLLVCFFLSSCREGLLWSEYGGSELVLVGVTAGGSSLTCPPLHYLIISLFMYCQRNLCRSACASCAG